MKRNHVFMLFFLVLFTGIEGGNAQVTNTGDLYVSPGTAVSVLESFRNEELAAFSNAGKLVVHGDFHNRESVRNDGELMSFGNFYNEENASLTNDGQLFLHADFSNEGLVDYRASGITYFRGTSQNQRIKGSGQTFFKDAVFNNDFSTAPFVLSDTLTVEGTVTFKRGIVDSDSFNGVFVFEEDADYTGASRHSHIDGPVVKRGDRSFTYPVGDQRFYRSASLSEPKDPTEKYETKYFKENSNQFYPHASKESEKPLEEKAEEGVLNYINEGEYWRVTPVTGKSELSLTLSWDESTTPEEIWQNPEAVRVVRWDAAKNLWVDEGGAVNERERTITTQISEFGIFTLGTVDLVKVLPCEVIVYNAVSPNDDNSNDAFVIETPEGVGPLSVQIFNRWGAKVFERRNYGEGGNLFRGYSEARGTVGSGKLPEGTYFYTLEYNCGDAGGGKNVSKAGYLYLSYNE